MTLAPDNIIAIRQRVRGSLHDLMMDVEREGDTELRAVLVDAYKHALQLQEQAEGRLH